MLIAATAIAAGAAIAVVAGAAAAGSCFCNRSSVSWRRIDKRRREKLDVDGRKVWGRNERCVGISVRGLLLRDAFLLLFPIRQSNRFF